jgi:hypothetical protein
MTRLLTYVAVATLAASPALAQPVTSTNGSAGTPSTTKATASAGIPALGSDLPLTGNASWPKLDWLYDVPSANDAAGKIVVHWFCAPRVPACVDDLARIVTLRETGKVYVIAYINGTKADAKKLDPIRESEGVGHGTLSFGRGPTALMKTLGLTGPASVVVDTDGKVQLVTAGNTPTDLDARDAKVNALSQALRDYTSTTDGPKTLKPGEKFTLSATIKLAGWLHYSDRTPRQMSITAPKDIKCDAMQLSGDQLKLSGQQLTASASCSGRTGVYEVRGNLTFGYDVPSGGQGLGDETVQWKFEIK